MHGEIQRWKMHFPVPNFLFSHFRRPDDSAVTSLGVTETRADVSDTSNDQQ